jgi:hypothetical protein
MNCSYLYIIAHPHGASKPCNSCLKEGHQSPLRSRELSHEGQETLTAEIATDGLAFFPRRCTPDVTPASLLQLHKEVGRYLLAWSVVRG